MSDFGEQITSSTEPAAKTSLLLPHEEISQYFSIDHALTVKTTQAAQQLGVDIEVRSVPEEIISNPDMMAALAVAYSDINFMELRDSSKNMYVDVQGHGPERSLQGFADSRVIEQLMVKYKSGSLRTEDIMSYRIIADLQDMNRTMKDYKQTKERVHNPPPLDEYIVRKLAYTFSTQMTEEEYKAKFKNDYEEEREREKNDLARETEELNTTYSLVSTEIQLLRLLNSSNPQTHKQAEEKLKEKILEAMQANRGYMK